MTFSLYYQAQTTQRQSIFIVIYLRFQVQTCVEMIISMLLTLFIDESCKTDFFRLDTPFLNDTFPKLLPMIVSASFNMKLDKSIYIVQIRGLIISVS